jgi:hypothetical protein
VNSMISSAVGTSSLRALASLNYTLFHFHFSFHLNNQDSSCSISPSFSSILSTPLLIMTLPLCTSIYVYPTPILPIHLSDLFCSHW